MQYVQYNAIMYNIYDTSWYNRILKKQNNTVHRKSQCSTLQYNTDLCNTGNTVYFDPCRNSFSSNKKVKIEEEKEEED